MLNPLKKTKMRNTVSKGPLDLNFIFYKLYFVKVYLLFTEEEKVYNTWPVLEKIFR